MIHINDNSTKQIIRYSWMSSVIYIGNKMKKKNNYHTVGTILFFYVFDFTQTDNVQRFFE